MHGNDTMPHVMGLLVIAHHLIKLSACQTIRAGCGRYWVPGEKGKRVRFDRFCSRTFQDCGSYLPTNPPAPTGVPEACVAWHSMLLVEMIRKFEVTPDLSAPQLPYLYFHSYA